jgi:Na+-transporting NADH:ubiquinone oxidoreductase subunit B
MLRKFLDWQLSLMEKGKPLHRLRPLVGAMDTFFYEPPCRTNSGPHIRDAVDLKRWMSIVVGALIPCILMAIWNTGIQKLVYASGNYHLMDEFLTASNSLQGYIDFATKDQRWFEILKLGLMAFLPLVIISYTVGGLWEVLFACVRGHEVAEGFLVTGMLYALILPPTIPYWMAAIGVSAGVILGKEVFGGTGMNIFNPALVCRCFLFFTFPSQMSGDIWVGTNPTTISESLATMNQEAQKPTFDAYSQATNCSLFNISTDIKRVHVDAITAHHLNNEVGTIDVIQNQLNHWGSNNSGLSTLQKLDSEQLRSFVTGTLDNGGLGLSPEYYDAAYRFANMQAGHGIFSDMNFFLGNKLGCLGETSVLACLIGAIILIAARIASWRTIFGTILGAFGVAYLFQIGASSLGADHGAWNAAKYAFPAYKHLLIGGLAFGAAFMATDPVTAPGNNLGRWIYGIFIGAVAIIIRIINPAYPEGVMLAILLGNAFAPLIDRICVSYSRRAHRVGTT